MNTLDPRLHRDEPIELFTDQGLLKVTFFGIDDTSYPCYIPYKVNRSEFEVDCSQIKSVWRETFREDLYHAIDSHYKTYFFLSHKDLTLNIIGL